jgi:metallo-beta-lactamase family protein
MSTHDDTHGVHIGFYGGTGTVTGSNFLFSTPKMRILIDCGLTQGGRVCDASNTQPFPYDLSTVDALFLTHAHIDHSGRIPRLVRAGFKGTIYSTPETKRLAQVVLPDSARIVAEEAAACHEEPAYREEDVPAVFERWEELPYYTPLSLGDCTVTLHNSGHILGSAMVEILHPRIGKTLFTGDLGNSPSILLKDTDEVKDVNYLVVESVYGDRLHEPVADRLAQFESIVEEVIAQRGVLLIPTFSLERTQDILFQLNELVEKSRIPRIPVFLDSPLAEKTTEIYRTAAMSNFNDAVRAAKEHGGDVFSFHGLSVTTSVRESKDIDATPGPKIIIAGSGMSNGGRIVLHEKRYLPEKNTTLLLVGYQAPGSLGRLLQEGASQVTIHDSSVPVAARVLSISGYSGHRDQDGIMNFVNGTNVSLKKAFVVMGEPKAEQFLAQHMRDYLGIDAVVPQLGDVVELT